MASWFKQLFSYFRAYHQPSPLLLRYMVVFGLAGFPLLYVMRFVRSSSGYDDLILRLFNVGILLLLAGKRHWPERLKAYELHSSYAVMVIVLPFTFVFTSLKNGGGPAAVGNTFMAVFLLMLLADWRNFIVMLIVGIGGAAAMYALTDPDPKVPLDYVLRFPVLLVGVVGGSLFKFALERATAERVRQAYASLAGSIAHEMRNPMAQVRHSLENIRQALPAPSLREQPQLVDGRSVERLYRHVAQGELAVQRGLQVIAMTLDEVNAKPLDPGRLAYLSAAEVCAKAVEEYGYESEQQRATVSLDVRSDFVFRGDETALLFVIFNLMKNALFYLPAYPNARLRVVVADGRIAVRDTGPGIAPEVIGTLFEPFNSTGKTGGTGLGLAYCRRMMRAVGGEIRCESVLGSHTEFALSFPSVDSKIFDAQRAEMLDETRRQWLDWRVLVVDDDSVLRKATRLELQALCGEVNEAENGLQALAALRDQHYDAVVLDLNMPDMSGYEVAERLRSGEAPLNRHVCLVAHTSEPGHLARVKVENAGFNGFVCKPADQLELLQAMHRAALARTRSRWRAAGWLEGRRLLLVDDNAYNRAAVAAYLKHAGAEVIEVGSGHAALNEWLAHDEWHAVILDIHMPGMSGVEVAQAIRTSDGKRKAVPILAITAHAGEALMSTARAAGIGDFVDKPVEATLLYERLGALMGLRPPLLETGTAPEAPLARSVLINERRLQGYDRIGMLEELLDDYVPRINALVDQLSVAAEQRDLYTATDALHSLLGMSGESGAQALYFFSRGVYIPLLERHEWPEDPNWVNRLRDLTRRSNHALRIWVETRRSKTTE